MLKRSVSGPAVLDGRCGDSRMSFISHRVPYFVPSVLVSAVSLNQTVFHKSHPSGVLCVSRPCARAAQRAVHISTWPGARARARACAYGTLKYNNRVKVSLLYRYGQCFDKVLVLK